MKFLVDLVLDGYEAPEEHDAACAEFIYDQLNFTASCVKVTAINESDLAEEKRRAEGLAAALEEISRWGVDPTSTAIAAICEKALAAYRGEV